MKANNKYWFFRMKTGFFNTPEIKAMLDVPHYGDKLVLTLLRLYDFSTYNRGFIKIRKVDEEDTYIRYLSEVLSLEYKFMAKAMKYYIENGFIEIYKDNIDTLLEIPYVKENTGKSSSEADRVRKLRNDISALEGIVEVETRGSLKSFGINSNVLLSSKEFKELKKKYRDISKYINLYSIDKNCNKCEVDNDFIELEDYINTKSS